jgi:hypothetical protein
MIFFGYELNETDIWLLRSTGTLFVILIGSIIYRTNANLIAKRKSHANDITNCIAPFNDAIANIHLGEASHIFIMNSFIRQQEEAIAIFKAQITCKNNLMLQDVWDKYKKHYEENAKGMTHNQFAVIDEPFKTKELDLLHKYLSNIIKEITRTKRIRLDCVSEANHNLNRLLDKPGII